MGNKLKKIWLINPGAMPPKYELRIQTLKRAQYLIELGYDVTIIGGSFLHNTNINLIDNNLSLIHISEPTRLGMISYAVFCLKKKNKKKKKKKTQIKQKHKKKQKKKNKKIN